MRLSAVVAVLIFFPTAPALASPAFSHDIYPVMVDAEMRLLALGINVTGYRQRPAPRVEWVQPSHPMLQGNDGAYAAGSVYVNDELSSACATLTLLHEIVHDVAVQMKLFGTVPDDKLRDVVEALSDHVTRNAAREPFRPRCIAPRQLNYSEEDLVRLAGATSP